MQMTLKEFRHLAQSTQSIVVSGAVIAAVALAWYAIKTYQRAQEEQEGTGAAN